MKIHIAIAALYLLCFCIPSSATAQAVGGRKPDTLTLAKSLRDEHEYGESARLLYSYLKYHPEDVNALWMNGQTELWRHRFRKSRALYKRAVAVSPGSDYLLLDYANTLAVIGKWDDAASVVQRLEDSGKYYSAANLVRANIAYWSARYPEAIAHADSVLAADPGNAAAQELLSDIRKAQSPWLQFNTDYISDNQPVQTLTTSVQAGTFIHRYLSPSLGIHAPAFMWNGKVAGVYRLEAGNQFLFPKAGIQADLSAGLAYFQQAAATDWTAAFTFRQQIRRFSWEVRAAQQPYTYTITSLDTALSFRRLAASMGWNDPNGPEGKIAAELNDLPGNQVYSVYGWVYTPPVKFFIFTLRLGYSYSYSDSRENSFISRRSLPEVIAAYDQPVTGMYYLFFTPKEQHIHAGLLQAHIRPGAGRWSGGINADAGLSARALNPYLYLDKDGDGTLFIARDYAPQDFFPCGVTVFSHFRITEKMTLSARYEYRQAWFFNTHTAGLGVKLHFWNERK